MITQIKPKWKSSSELCAPQLCTVPSVSEDFHYRRHPPKSTVRIRCFLHQRATRPKNNLALQSLGSRPWQRVPTQSNSGFLWQTPDPPVSNMARHKFLMSMKRHNVHSQLHHTTCKGTCPDVFHSGKDIKCVTRTGVHINLTFRFTEAILIGGEGQSNWPIIQSLGCNQPLKLAISF